MVFDGFSYCAPPGSVYLSISGHCHAGCSRAYFLGSPLPLHVLTNTPLIFSLVFSCLTHIVYSIRSYIYIHTCVYICVCVHINDSILVHIHTWIKMGAGRKIPMRFLESWVSVSPRDVHGPCHSTLSTSSPDATLYHQPDFCLCSLHSRVPQSS